MQASWAVGWGVALVVQAVLFSLVPQAQAWRFLFMIGILRPSWSCSSAAWSASPRSMSPPKKTEAETGVRPSVLEIFRPPCSGPPCWAG